MPHLSLTEFVDVVSKVGMRKITALTTVKKRQELGYHPSRDYYKLVREHIIILQSNGHSKDEFLNASELTSNKKKWNIYTEVIDGYKKFWGRKNIDWFDPAKASWNSNNIDINLNPELGLIYKGQAYSIKLYFKSEPLSKVKVDMSLFLMHQFLPKSYNGYDIIYSILDVRHANLIIPTSFPANILPALVAETAYINSIWNSLESSR